MTNQDMIQILAEMRVFLLFLTQGFLEQSKMIHDQIASLKENSELFGRQVDMAKEMVEKVEKAIKPLIEESQKISVNDLKEEDLGKREGSLLPDSFDGDQHGRLG